MRRLCLVASTVGEWAGRGFYNQILSDSWATGNFYESFIDHAVTVIDRNGAIKKFV
jgi:hypothetical protein